MVRLSLSCCTHRTRRDAVRFSTSPGEAFVPRVLVAGATGYLGNFLVAEARKRGYWVRALARSEQRLSPVRAAIDEVFIGEVTRPSSLTGMAQGIDVVISSIGITRQKDGLRYRDVDYQGNLNILREALGSGVRKFVYVSVFNADRMSDLQIVRAKECFVNELRESGIDYAVIRPNGYFRTCWRFWTWPDAAGSFCLAGATFA